MLNCSRKLHCFQQEFVRIEVVEGRSTDRLEQAFLHRAQRQPLDANYLVQFEHCHRNRHHRRTRSVPFAIELEGSDQQRESHKSNEDTSSAEGEARSNDDIHPKSVVREEKVEQEYSGFIVSPLFSSFPDVYSGQMDTEALTV